MTERDSDWPPEHGGQRAVWVVLLLRCATCGRARARLLMGVYGPLERSWNVHGLTRPCRCSDAALPDPAVYDQVIDRAWRRGRYPVLLSADVRAPLVVRI